jgi:hypothetical protein
VVSYTHHDRILQIIPQTHSVGIQIRYQTTSTLTEDNNITTEIKQRIVMENRATCGLKKQLSSQYLGRQTKFTSYKTLVRPIHTYGSESWTLKRTEENMLRIFDRRILRRMFGPVEENGIWRSSYNHELYIMNQI